MSCKTLIFCQEANIINKKLSPLKAQPTPQFLLNCNKCSTTSILKPFIIKERVSRDRPIQQKKKNWRCYQGARVYKST